MSTRGKLTSAFNEDALEKTFGDIEIFLAVFQGDDNIIEASVDLLATTLRAVENTMAFFLSHQGTHFLLSFHIIVTNVINIR